MANKLLTKYEIKARFKVLIGALVSIWAIGLIVLVVYRFVNAPTPEISEMIVYDQGALEFSVIVQTDLDTSLYLKLQEIATEDEFTEIEYFQPISYTTNSSDVSAEVSLWNRHTSWIFSRDDTQKLHNFRLTGLNPDSDYRLSFTTGTDRVETPITSIELEDAESAPTTPNVAVGNIGRDLPEDSYILLSSRDEAQEIVTTTRASLGVNNTYSADISNFVATDNLSMIIFSEELEAPIYHRFAEVTLNPLPDIDIDFADLVDTDSVDNLETKLVDVINAQEIDSPVCSSGVPKRTVADGYRSITRDISGNDNSDFSWQLVQYLEQNTFICVSADPVGTYDPPTPNGYTQEYFQILQIEGNSSNTNADITVPQAIGRTRIVDGAAARVDATVNEQPIEQFEDLPTASRSSEEQNLPQSILDSEAELPNESVSAASDAIALVDPNVSRESDLGDNISLRPACRSEGCFTDLFNEISPIVADRLGLATPQTISFAYGNMTCRRQSGGLTGCDPALLKSYYKYNDEVITGLYAHEIAHQRQQQCRGKSLSPPIYDKQALRELAAEVFAILFVEQNGGSTRGIYEFVSGTSGNIRIGNALQAQTVIVNTIRDEIPSLSNISDNFLADLYNCDDDAYRIYVENRSEVNRVLTLYMLNGFRQSFINYGTRQLVGTSLAQRDVLDTEVRTEFSHNLDLDNRGSILGKVSAQEAVSESAVYEFSSGELVGNADIVIDETTDTRDLDLNYFRDENNNGVQDEGEPTVLADQVQVEQGSLIRTYSLAPAWNLISAPINSTGSISASLFIDEFNEGGGGVSRVARYLNNQFEIYDVAGFGPDFDILPGQALFVYQNGLAQNVTVYSEEVVEDPQIPWQSGWNLVAFPSNTERQTEAAAFIERIAREEDIVINSFSQFENGRYQSVVQEELDGQSTVFGNSFNIVPTRGYFVKVESGGGESLSL